MARLLHSKGYKDVRPLLGGLDAWMELGYPTERHAAASVPLTTITASASVK